MEKINIPMHIKMHIHMNIHMNERPSVSALRCCRGRGAVGGASWSSAANPLGRLARAKLSGVAVRRRQFKAFVPLAGAPETRGSDLLSVRKHRELFFFFAGRGDHQETGEAKTNRGAEESTPGYQPR